MAQIPKLLLRGSVHLSGYATNVRVRRLRWYRVEWSASVPSTGFSFTSDPATTSKTVFAEIGSERNGVFFHGAA